MQKKGFMEQTTAKINLRALFNTTVLVSALGYFVDIYDLILFSIVRVPSLTSLGVPQKELGNVGLTILNMQMAGMLVGGILWGILGDKKGRLSVLFGSILLYSIANFANAFVLNTDVYALLRFIAGVGLAGQLGAAVTLVSEVMPKETRGYGTALVATIGVTGAIFAAIVGELFTWHTAYIIGGVLGFVLLLTRMHMFESGIFKTVKTTDVAKGKFTSLFTSRDRFFRYLNCILIGLPIWFVVGVLVTLSPEFGKILGYHDPIVAGRSVMFTYTGLIFGDFLSGFISQLIKSRRKVVLFFLLSTLVFILIYLYLPGKSAAYFYSLCFALGFSIGYWAVFVTVASEQFGTNLRATVTITVPNFVRGAVVVLVSAFKLLIPRVGMINAALIVSTVSIAIAITSLYHLHETFGRDLDFVEEV